MTGLAAAVTDVWVGRTDPGSLSWTAGRIASRRSLAWARAGATRAWARRRAASPGPSLSASFSPSSSSPSSLPLAWVGAGPEGRAVAVALGSRALLRLVPDGGGPALSVEGTFSPGRGEDGPEELLMARLRAREKAAAAHFSSFIYPGRGAGSSYGTGVATGS